MKTVGRSVFSTGSVRDTSEGKVPLQHISDVEEGLGQMCAVLEFGATKYSRNNWRKGQPYMRVVASLLRHVMAFARGEDIDPESGQPHMGHVMCNAAFLAHFVANHDDPRYAGLDDRDPMGDPDVQ